MDFWERHSGELLILLLFIITVATLMVLVPQLIREARPDARIGFFLHIPCPASEAPDTCL